MRLHQAEHLAVTHTADSHPIQIPMPHAHDASPLPTKRKNNIQRNEYVTTHYELSALFVADTRIMGSVNAYFKILFVDNRKIRYNRKRVVAHIELLRQRLRIMALRCDPSNGSAAPLKSTHGCIGGAAGAGRGPTRASCANNPPLSERRRSTTHRLGESSGSSRQQVDQQTYFTDPLSKDEADKYASFVNSY
ncbi:hypothetical protein EVAR_53108_1 [Eumeta japonica]|uniref:Uncharacterized protein n=1 Tax=Eumeta variegata TaxID=151549 RepID=A0A4C1YAY4_EUMVA|nr:hypothetical protein EVAR_53108_1 [Eumeta japonica]